MYKTEIKNLLLLCLGKEDTFQTKSTIGFNCDCTIATHNRVIADKNFKLSELQEINKFHKNPYAIWLDSDNINTKNMLNNDGRFELAYSFPGMKLDLSILKPTPHDDHISIRRVTSEDNIIATWIPIVIKAYNPSISEAEFKKFLEGWRTFFSYLKNSKTYKNMYFFLGYWNNIPAATGLFIVKDDTVNIHWIGSLPEFRNKGLGLAVTSNPLYDLSIRHFFLLQPWVSRFMKKWVLKPLAKLMYTKQKYYKVQRSNKYANHKFYCMERKQRICCTMPKR